MAAEKVNTRQKMINMMYLVFIAMLALNISKEVLGTLGILSEDMEKSTAELKSSIDDLYTTIDLNSNQDYYKIPSEELPKLRDLTDDYWSYIQMLKDSLISLDKNNYLTNVSVKNEDGEKTEVTMVDYQIMDKSVDLDELFFKGDGNSEKGAEFVSYFSSFKTNVTAVLDSIISRDERTIKSNYSFASAISNLESRFNYSEDVLNSDGNYQPWLEYNYQGFPLIASLSKFTKIQSDIRAVEYEILNSLTSKTKDRKLSLDNTDTLLETTQSAYYTNSTVDAAVVVGRTDSSFKPDVVDLKIDGVDLKESEFSIVNGKIVLDKRFSTPGIKNITGFLIFKADGEIDSLGVDQKFYVINKPNDAIVSPLNMQVFYIGLRNEIKVAFPGIADLSSIRVNGKNGSILKNGSRYFAAPNAGVSSMDVIVSGRANNETLTSVLNFRVEDAPPGRGSIFERVGGKDINYINSSKISKDALLYGTVRGEKPPGFLYDYDINVETFQITVGNLPTRTVQGNKIQNSNEAMRDIRGANRGSSVTLTVLKATKIDGDLKSPTNVEPFVLTIE
jgi:gliding motility-associated protein GldM|tara:strand:+ start:1454 stop:3136 length:1683 start_codon:yes stop_codon:yes gene_type:complete